MLSQFDARRQKEIRVWTVQSICLEALLAVVMVEQTQQRYYNSASQCYFMLESVGNVPQCFREHPERDDDMEYNTPGRSRTQVLLVNSL